MNDQPRKALHEYRREATQDELDQIARYLAEGQTKTYMAKAMGQTTDRISRLVRRVEVMNAAVRIRETELIPRALAGLEIKQGAVLDAVVDLVSRVTALEGHVSRLSKAMAMKGIKYKRSQETVKALRAERDQLRSELRRRGIGY